MSSVALLVCLIGCAGEAERGAQPVRDGPTRDGALPDGALDLGLPDAAVDAAPADAGPPPERAVWLVVREADHREGVRARLQPPHVPLGVDPREALPEAALLVAWAGPADDGLLGAAWAADRPTGVLYDLGARIAGRADPAEQQAVAVADVSGLLSALSEARMPLRWQGAPVVVVDGPWDAPMVEAFAAARARADALGVALAWGAMVDPTAPWIASDPGDDAGPPPLPLMLPRCALADAAARNRARLWSTRRGAGAWLPCVTPATNPRLDHPRAPAEAPRIETFAQRLVLARRVGAPAIVVDGAGGWRDDRQLDPVGGAPTGAPIALTTGQVYLPYGDGRLSAARRLLLAPAGPALGPVGDPPALLDLVRSTGVIVERLEQAADGLALRLRDATESGRYEVLLDERAFIVEPGLTLAYARTDPALTLDLVFEDGARLLDLLPDDGALEVRRSLDPLVGRRVEEVTLVYAGGRAMLDARIVDARIEAAP